MFGDVFGSPLFDCSGVELVVGGEMFFQFVESLLRVAEDADFDGVVLADLPGVFVDVDEADVFGDGPRGLEVDVLAEQVHADDEEDVVFFESLADFGGPEGEALAVEWMVAGEGEAAVGGAAFSDNGGTECFGDGD